MVTEMVDSEAEVIFKKIQLVSLTRNQLVETIDVVDDVVAYTHDRSLNFSNQDVSLLEQLQSFVEKAKTIASKVLDGLANDLRTMNFKQKLAKKANINAYQR